MFYFLKHYLNICLIENYSFTSGYTVDQQGWIKALPSYFSEHPVLKSCMNMLVYFKMESFILYLYIYKCLSGQKCSVDSFM